MSKIGKLPIAIPAGVTIEISDRVAKVTGGKGTLSFELPKGINAAIEESVLKVSQEPKTADHTKALFGLTRSLIDNMVRGVSEGFEKRLELVGVGYRAQVAGKDLTLSLGFSHPVKFTAPDGITFAYIDNQIIISGIDKALVGNIAAKIRAVRPPEPYKGKGIKYVGEYIRRKAGKAAKAVGSK